MKVLRPPSLLLQLFGWFHGQMWYCCVCDRGEGVKEEESAVEVFPVTLGTNTVQPAEA